MATRHSYIRKPLLWNKNDKAQKLKKNETYRNLRQNGRHRLKPE
jgi:hypothetical protein